MNIINHISLSDAIKELQTKTLNNIQVETAITWINRACAAMQMNNTDDAREYAHEAVEHAALSGDINLVTSVYDALHDYGIVL